MDARDHQGGNSEGDSTVGESDSHFYSIPVRTAADILEVSVESVQTTIDQVLCIVDCTDDEIQPYDAQSGIEQGYVLAETMKSQNVRFSDQYNGPTTTIAGRADEVRSMTDTKDTSLEHFFSRPIKIHEQTWAIGAGMDIVINPWDEYFSDTRVVNRITTYNLMRANLHIKIVVNGNGFYYGRAMAMYGPFNDSSFDSMSLTTSAADITQWSQRPKVFINPTNSMAGEMVIPFHDYRNNVYVQDGSWDKLGSIWLRSINILKHANGSNKPVTVSVYAWAEDVELSVLTSMDAGALAPQSGEEVDEANSKGVISGPATAVAKWSSYLKDAPVIGPYATATSKAASVTAEIAKMFGYSRPPITKAPEPYKPTTVSSLANTTVPDVVCKLSVDDKQELTIDPAIAGFGVSDPLSIKSIASRESYLTTFTWLSDASPEGTTKAALTGLLWNCRVDPCMWNSTGSAFVFPACAAAALPFKYWTGTMKFRFQIVSSSFHKGRLKFVYDPNQVSSNEYNTNYLKVIDIADEQDVTLEVGVGRPTTLLKHAKPGVDSLANMYSTSPLTYSDDLGNGVLSVYIVNELTVPSDIVANNVEVNVFVSMGDDFEVFVPDQHFQNFVFAAQSGEEFGPQSGVEAPMTTGRLSSTVPESEHTDEPNAPIQMKSENIAVSSMTLPLTNLAYTGESIQSFRTMLKRYNRWMTFGRINNDADACRINLQAKAFPALRGNVPGAIHTTSLAAPYNYVNTVLLHWVTYMFSGWRGGIRYKVIPRRGIQYCDIVASRHPANGNGFGVQTGNYSPTSYSSQSEISQSTVYTEALIDAEQSGHEGLAYTNSLVNPVLEFEVPYYSRFRFSPGKTINWSTTDDDRAEFYTVFVNQVNDRPDIGVSVGCYDMFVSIGEDFQTFFFTGLPRMYYEASAPAPAL